MKVTLEKNARGQWEVRIDVQCLATAATREEAIEHARRSLAIVVGELSMMNRLGPGEIDPRD